MIVMRPLVRMNKDRLLAAVMETRPGIDREKAKRMIDALFEMDTDE